MVPFRGDYYTLVLEARPLVNGLVYPVPDPRFPFLGVHFTRRMNDEVWAGPNAVLAFAREGYRRRDIVARDLAETLTYPGFWRLARPYLRTGLAEMWRDAWKPAFVGALQRYVPELQADQLVFGPSGVRAQAVSPDGSMVDDFAIGGTGNVLHVINAPSRGDCIAGNRPRPGGVRCCPIFGCVNGDEGDEAGFEAGSRPELLDRSGSWWRRRCSH